MTEQMQMTLYQDLNIFLWHTWNRGCDRMIWKCYFELSDHCLCFPDSGSGCIPVFWSRLVLGYNMINLSCSYGFFCKKIFVSDPVLFKNIKTCFSSFISSFFSGIQFCTSQQVLRLQHLFQVLLLHLPFWYETLYPQGFPWWFSSWDFWIDIYWRSWLDVSCLGNPVRYFAFRGTAAITGTAPFSRILSFFSPQSNNQVNSCENSAYNDEACSNHHSPLFIFFPLTFLPPSQISEFFLSIMVSLKSIFVGGPADARLFFSIFL